MIAEWIVKEPARILELSSSFERYLSLIRMIASNWHLISSSLRSKMKQSKWFLGLRVKREGEDEDDELVYTHELVRPSDCIIVDNPSAALIFPLILGCPQETAIETLAQV